MNQQTYSDTGATPDTMAVSTIYTIEEAAAYLKVKPHTVRAWIQQGKIKSFSLGDLVRIHEDDLQAFIDAERERCEREALSGYRKVISEVQHLGEDKGEFFLQVRWMPKGQRNRVIKEIASAGLCNLKLDHDQPDWIEGYAHCERNIDAVLDALKEKGWEVREAETL